MKLVLNGDEREIDGSRTVADLLNYLGFSDIPMLVEHNGTALFPREFPATELQNGDRLEIIRVVAGG